MKHQLYILPLMLFAVASAFAQDFDRQTLSDIDILGTARYVSVAGAMTAVGGDVSAAADNPAALGIFRRGELSFSASYKYDAVTSGGNFANARRVHIPQISWVINFQHPERQKGLLSSSLMLQYHQRKQFIRNAAYSGVQSVSLTDLMADLTHGLEESRLQASDWDINKVGALSKTAYELYLIDPDTENKTYWHSVLNEGEKADASLSVNERGSTNDYTVGWGANISNKVWLGISANLTSISYSRTSVYTEKPEDGGSFAVTSSLAGNGFGFHANVGIVAQPADFLRLGFSLHTPTWMTMKFASSTSSTGNMSTPAGYQYSPASATDDHYTMPMRTTCGMAFLFSTKGMLSFEYDWNHQPKYGVADLHQLKLGAEVVVNNKLFLRAGYAFASRFPKGDVLFSPSYDDLRTDTDFKNQYNLHYASAGVGFRNRFMLVELAYQCRIENSRYYAFARPLYSSVDSEPYDWQSVSFDHRGLTHLLVFSIGWTPRRR